MDSSSRIFDLVAPWQDRSFRGESTLTLEEGATSIEAGTPLVEPRMCQKASKWMMFERKTNEVAIFTHAGIWAWGSPKDTGNFVPPNETPSPLLNPERIQREISYKCEESYAFDTTIDDSLYSYLQVFEDDIVKNPKFNTQKRSRRTWQNGQGDTGRYILTSKIFAQSRSGTISRKSAEVHPWVRKAAKESRGQYIPNPEKPVCYEYIGESLSHLASSNRPEFESGDIIWMSFKVGFSIGKNDWGLDILPIEFIRVGRLPDDLVRSDFGTYQTRTLDELQTGQTILVATRRVALGNDAQNDGEDQDLELRSKFEALRPRSDDEFFGSREDPNSNPPSTSGSETSHNANTQGEDEDFVNVSMDVDATESIPPNAKRSTRARASRNGHGSSRRS